MGIFDQELILPGVITEIIPSYSQNYDTSKWGTTDSVCVIGTAFNGPVGKPVKIYSPEYAEYVFGGTFDSLARKEASLVAEIKNCWDRGCRTIYGIRISGKDIYKDFNLASNIDCKLRVSSQFANNEMKKCFFEYDDASSPADIALGKEPCIRIYKPADKATIAEKYTGKVVKQNSVLVNEIGLLNNLNITASSRLCDFIKTFNSYTYNNVLYLSLVDADGNDITETEMAQSLTFAELLHGIYFIGRSKNEEGLTAVTNIREEVVNKDNAEEYANYAGEAVKKLVYNTDITKPYPIYHSDVDGLNSLIVGIKSITMTKLFDFLLTPGLVDYIWPMDKIDYEEVSLTDFDIYKRLGCGFANTAKIVETKPADKDGNGGSGIYKVVAVTDTTDENRIYAIEDGIYSVLQNLPADYRVLACRNADTVIKGKLPRKKEFKVRKPASFSIFSGAIKVSPKVDSDDISDFKKAYKFELRTLSEAYEKDEIMNNLYANAPYVEYAMPIAESQTAEGTTAATVIDDSTVLGSKLENGQVAISGTTPYVMVDGKLTDAGSLQWFKEMYNGRYFVCGQQLYKYDGTSLTAMAASSETEAEPVSYFITTINGKETVCSYDNSNIDYITTIDQLNDETSTLYAVEVPSLETIDGKLYEADKVIISAAELDSSTLMMFAVALNSNSMLSSIAEYDTAASDMLKIKTVLGEDGLFALPAEDSVVDTKNPNIGVTVESGMEQGLVGADEESHLDSGDIVYDTDLYIPYKTTDNFVRQLAQHCIYTSLKTKPTHGFIGVSKLMNAGLKSIDDRVNKLVATDFDLYAKKNNGNYMLNKDNTPYDIGRAVSVTVFQNTVDTGDNYTYVSNGASAYAGMVSCLPLDQSSTSQAINIDDIGYEFTNYQLGRLTQAGFVTVKDSYTKGYVVTDGVTKALANSSFARLAVTRIVNAIDNAIRSAAEPYIGKPNNAVNRNSLEAAIKSVLDNLQDNLIQRYSFQVTSDASLEKLGIIKIDYEILPVYEIRDVKNNITIKEE